MRTMLGVLALAVTFQATDTEQGPIPKEKWSAGHADKLWGVKVRTVKYRLNQQPAEYRVVLEFTRDLKPEELSGILRAFGVKEPDAGASAGDKVTPRRIEFHFFDDDGVVVERYGTYKVEGEITGKTGDAFRAIISLPDRSSYLNRPGNSEKIKKVELRIPVSDKP
jgi:hypothetical protein